ncbi:MAG: hypothetical protein JWP61_1982, partial [Friedmanniella sp.]|nr:hypothetical protein [Friedmanniella sp.]
LDTLPPGKRQPNLVFAAARWNGVPAPAPYAQFRRALLADWQTVADTVRSRATQTNEVGRLATLTPVLVRLQQRTGRPLALLEVGASAGLCLIPDRFGYRWVTGSGAVVVPPSAPRPGAVPDPLVCTVTGPAPLPSAGPQVGWRAGVDLHPLDVLDDDAMAWLEILVWPEQQQRRDRLRQAVALARADPPRLVAGDLLERLPELLAEVPAGLTPVVFHSAVAAYLPDDRRAEFAALMGELVAAGRCHWVSNEGPNVLPDVTATGPALSAEPTTFVLGCDGRAVAWSHPHGTTLTWFGP